MHLDRMVNAMGNAMGKPLPGSTLLPAALLSTTVFASTFAPVHFCYPQSSSPLLPPSSCPAESSSPLQSTFATRRASLHHGFCFHLCSTWHCPVFCPNLSKYGSASLLRHFYPGFTELLGPTESLPPNTKPCNPSGHSLSSAEEKSMCKEKRGECLKVQRRPRTR